MKKRHQIRQGDVLICPIDRFPTGLTKKDKTLAYGEVTGHSHRFEASDDEVLVSIAKDGTQYIEVLKPTTLKHEEHGNLEIEEGKYVVRQQREHDIQTQQERRVLD